MMVLWGSMHGIPDRGEAGYGLWFFEHGKLVQDDRLSREMSLSSPDGFTKVRPVLFLGLVREEERHYNALPRLGLDTGSLFI